MVYIKESLTPIVYHYCSIDSLVDILNTNQFHLESNLGTDADQIPHTQGYHYFLSTSRIFYGGYVRRHLTDGGVIITLNGDKLNQRYRAVPVDYWGEHYRNAAYNQGDYESFFKNNENEDRLLSNKENIPNAIDYILAVDFCVWGNYSKEESYEGITDDTEPRMVNAYRFWNSKYRKAIESTYTFLTKQKIRCTIYIDAQDFIKRNEKNTITPTKLSDYVQMLVDYLEGKLPVDNNGNLAYSKEYAEIYDAVRSKWTSQEFARILGSEIHTQKTDQYARHNIQVITNAMRKYNAKNLQELMLRLYQEYDKKLNSTNRVNNLLNPRG